MMTTLDEIDKFLTELLEQGDWVKHTRIPGFFDLSEIRFTTGAASVNFRDEDVSVIRHYDKNGLINMALDKRMELKLGSEMYDDKDSKKVATSII